MNQERDRILDLLATGKINAEEAARLLDALGPRQAQAADAETAAKTAGTAGAAKSSTTPKFMYVKVVSVKGDNVNVKIPLSLVRAGLKLTSLIPPQAMDQINKSMAEHGMKMDVSNLKPEDLEDLIESLREMEVNVDAANGDNVRVYAA
jgi:SHOCT-like domain